MCPAGLLVAGALLIASGTPDRAAAQELDVGILAGGAIPATRFAEDRTIGPLGGAFVMLSPATLPARIRLGAEFAWLREPLPDAALPEVRGDRLSLVGGNGFAVVPVPRGAFRSYVLAGGVLTRIESHGENGFTRTAAGVGVGGGVELPAWRGHIMAEVRLHALLDAGRPVPVYLPIVLGVRF